MADMWLDLWKTWGNALVGMRRPEPRTGATMAQLWTGLWKAWSGPMAPPAKTPDALSRSVAPPWQAAWDYWVDACQRTILFWDVMRKRGNMFLEHEQQGKPPVLSFEHEMVLDGRTLERPATTSETVRLNTGAWADESRSTQK